MSSPGKGSRGDIEYSMDPCGTPLLREAGCQERTLQEYILLSSLYTKAEQMTLNGCCVASSGLTMTIPGLKTWTIPFPVQEAPLMQPRMLLIQLLFSPPHPLSSIEGNWRYIFLPLPPSIPH